MNESHVITKDEEIVERLISHLRGLLHYHERVMPRNGVGVIDMDTMTERPCTWRNGKPCLYGIVQDEYACALREAIRCMEIVHGMEITDQI